MSNIGQNCFQVTSHFSGHVTGCHYPTDRHRSQDWMGEMLPRHQNRREFLGSPGDELATDDQGPANQRSLDGESDVELTAVRPYVIGYLCQQISSVGFTCSRAPDAHASGRHSRTPAQEGR